MERRRKAEATAGVERLPVFGTHIKAKKADEGGYRAMESEDKVSSRPLLLTTYVTNGRRIVAPCHYFARGSSCRVWTVESALLTTLL